jgi:peptidoglycan/xylan/chitin deacetylase (PgdA/CDA1 family)
MNSLKLRENTQTCWPAKIKRYVSITFLLNAVGPELTKRWHTIAMSQSKHRAFAAAFSFMSATGLGKLAAPYTRGAGAILMLHHVRPWQERALHPNRLLEITPEFLDVVLERVKAAGFDVIAIDALPQRLEAGGKPFVVITLDDAYRDNLVHALPVFQKHAAPFTVFAVPGFADGIAPLWWIDIEEAIAKLSEATIFLPERTRHFSMRTLDEKKAVFDKVYWEWRQGPEMAMRAEIDRLARLAGLDPLARTRALCLDWNGLRQLAADPLCTIGAHSMTHLMLAKQDAGTAQTEILASRKRLEAELQRPIRHFAYPVGDPASAGEREFAMAKEAGFVSAVTTRPGMLFGDHQARLQALPRLSVNGFHQNQAAIDALLSGLPFFLLNKGKRLV